MDIFSSPQTFGRDAATALADNSASFIPSSPFFELSTLNGSNGFTINGSRTGDFSGGSVSRAGDVNGDGIDDFIINELSNFTRNERSSGQSYVVFGKSTGFQPTLDLSTLDGRSGFILRSNPRVGIVTLRTTAKSAGDVNGDGLDDLIVSENILSLTDPSVAERSYVVFGRSTGFPRALNLSTLNGRTGFVIKEDGGNLSDAAVSGAGDVNGDGFDDLIIGAPGAKAVAGDNAGQIYVVFGKSTGFQPTLDLRILGGNIFFNGFVLQGAKAGDRFGAAVSGAGDVNGDGFDDLIIGAPGADANGKPDSGQSYVVFGSNSPRRPVLTISPLIGAKFINGIAAGDGFSFTGVDLSVSSAGDVNGDGIDDLIIGAPGADADDTDSGRSYVVFGSKTGFSTALDLSALNGNNGFAIDGIAGEDLSGYSVSGAGDVNGDGIDDLIIGAPRADSSKSDAGQSYLIFGSKTGFSASLNPTILNGNNGFVINGIALDDFSGYSVSGAGDVNGDGTDDLIIGAPGVDANGNVNSGQSYVIFGQRSASAIALQDLLGVGRNETHTSDPQL